MIWSITLLLILLVLAAPFAIIGMLFLLTVHNLFKPLEGPEQ